MIDMMRTAQKGLEACTNAKIGICSKRLIKREDLYNSKLQLIRHVAAKNDRIYESFLKLKLKSN